MDTVTSTRASLNRRKGEWPRICKSTGLSYGWVTKFAQGKIEEPGVRKIQKLEGYIAANPTDEVVPAGQVA